MWELDVENVGGIRSGHATIERGVNVVQASNFRGKSSLIAAVKTALGATGSSNDPLPLTAGTETGRSTLDTPDGTYEVRLRRDGTVVSSSGTPYLTDERDRFLARAFASLGESNPVRAAVRTGDWDRLSELIQRPIDLQEIGARIASLQSEKEEIEDERSDAARAKERLPERQETVTRLERELDDLRERREELADEVDEPGRTAQLGDELSTARQKLETEENAIARIENTVERKREKVERKRAELNGLVVPPEPDAEENLDAKRERIDRLDLRIGLLGDLHRVHLEILEEDELDLVTTVDRGLRSDDVTCWTCGATTTREDLRTRLDELTDRLASLRNERSTLETELEEAERREAAFERKNRERTRLREEIDGLEVELDEHEHELEGARERRAELAETVERPEREVQAAGEALDEELADVRASIRITEHRLEEAETRLEELETKRRGFEDLRERSREIQDEIVALRTEKRRQQEELQARFNEELETIISTFAPGFDGGRLDVARRGPGGREIEEFELTIVREGREGDLHTLSEGERELVGIATAMAAYKTFDVGERVPVLIVDGIGQLAAEHLRNLIAYLEDSCEILVTTAYPEAGGFDGHAIVPDEWSVVSDGERA